MLFQMEDIGSCKRCGSGNTKIEFMVPSAYPEKLRGHEGEQAVEIFCGDCGKINRTQTKMIIS